jgi:hypothetical protein
MPSSTGSRRLLPLPPTPPRHALESFLEFIPLRDGDIETLAGALARLPFADERALSVLGWHRASILQSPIQAMSSPPDVLPTLEGCEDKLRRARGQAVALRDEVRALFEAHPYEIIPEHQPGARQYVFHVRRLGPIDPDWPLLIGECLFNLRSALDHLALQLAILGQWRDLTPEEEARCAFPIADTEAKFQKSQIQLLRYGEKARITELQPFNAWDSSIWGLMNTPHPLAGYLGRLNTLHNIDKHRKLHAIWHGITGFPMVPPGFTGAGATDQRLEDGAEIGSWSYEGTAPEIPDNVDVERYFPIGITLDEPSVINDPVELLTVFTNTVSTIIDIFRPCIMHEGDPPLPLHGLVAVHPPPGDLHRPL